ncbi:MULTISPECIES: WhiB family transcriptional regulator [Nocardia]|uniref:Transcriptional regulator WhiB n=1 Tax=Nocardia nova TaxID=37330 RepID=A0A2T2Z8A4_9NOCA|nr:MULTISPECIES: WhiB family transcriptional regulator [Nocardia]PSR63959.1 WhiB family transcriptional regulator [Nocardia nova]
MAEWRQDALCRADPDPDVFYPDPSDQSRALDAKALCVVCPVRRACAEDAADRHERFGIHGGFRTDDPDEWERLHVYIGRPVPPRRTPEQQAVRCSQCGTEFVAREPDVDQCGPCKRGLVPAEPSIARVRELRDAGWKFGEIAAAAGVSYSTVQSLPRPGREWVSADAEKRILSIEVAPEQAGAA